MITWWRVVLQVVIAFCVAVGVLSAWIGGDNLADWASRRWLWGWKNDAVVIVTLAASFVACVGVIVVCLLCTFWLWGEL